MVGEYTGNWGMPFQELWGYAELQQNAAEEQKNQLTSAGAALIII